MCIYMVVEREREREGSALWRIEINKGSFGPLRT